MNFLRPWEGTIYGIFRFLVGALFMEHGLQKIFGLFGGVPEGVPAFVIYLGGGIELMGGLLVALGWHTRIAAFLASGMMAVAYFTVHQPQGLFPILNKGEPAILYCWLFLLIAARGSGKFSVDGEST